LLGPDVKGLSCADVVDCGIRLTARFTHRHGHITVIAVYAPTEKSTAGDKDEFYTTLEDVKRSVTPHDQLIVAGDLNAVLGTDRLGFEQLVGPGVENDNTLRLLTYCSDLGLSLVGSWFRRPDIRRWTWISNDGFTKKEIDLMLTRRRQDFASYRVYRGAECPANTDH